MEPVNYAEIFARFDDAVYWEYPPGFDYSDAVLRFRAFVAELHTLVEAEVAAETESHIQDASFHSQIRLDESTIRFSNFGEMIAIVDEDQLKPKTRDILMKLIERSGYLYVPETALEAAYTGKNSGVTGIRDWRTRYFDWV